MLWLMSNVFCLLVGFLIATKGCFKAKAEKTTKAQIDPEILRKAEREARELHNMLTYDGTVQEEFKDY